ncbi:histidinol dehydrogenase [Caldalkalibacillus mannanilyticus]|uniref:histidinol dehydrogenase n=1 Tax=Caldalkalibacillus mannanilyticus TaxID=1418 RepID=UPI00046AF883|nr:histidinol dehydrogenase [Caldalkalibacillus mannanilyticus]
MLKIVKNSADLSLKRSVEGGTEEQRAAVLSILEDVKQEGDRALLRYTAAFDRVELETLRVTQQEIEEAYQEVEIELVDVLKNAMNNIQRFHEKQKRSSWLQPEESGTILGQVITPLARVGVYVPGGTAPLVSTVLMNVIPAKIAGVEEIVMFTPPQSSGRVMAGILVAADLLGVTEIYKVGGAQAIAAAAYGTETIAPVDKIVGPGNIYVALAKREVFGLVDIDMIAGPSDLVVLADEQQNPVYIAADLLSQAEHDTRSAVVCVTPSEKLAKQIQQEVERQLATLPRQEIARAALEEFGAIYVTKTLEEAVDIVNQLAPEHLEILVESPFEWVGKIKNAGAIFLGEYSSEPVGDYFAGPNHVLPTNGTARFSSPLNVDDFIKKSSLIYYSKKDLLQNADQIMKFARYEGLEAHARAIQVRVEKERE